MLVHCASGLGSAAPLLAAELRYCDGVLTTWALERGRAIDQFDGVISHSFKSSPLCHYGSELKLPFTAVMRENGDFAPLLGVDGSG